jgi:small-conductance mechanosensitive channel
MEVKLEGCLEGCLEGILKVWLEVWLEGWLDDRLLKGGSLKSGSKARSKVTLRLA